MVDPFQAYRRHLAYGIDSGHGQMVETVASDTDTVTDSFGAYSRYLVYGIDSTHGQMVETVASDTDAVETLDGGETQISVEVIATECVLIHNLLTLAEQTELFEYIQMND